MLFLDIRDSSGLLQAVSVPGDHPQAHALAERLRQEYVVRCQGTLRLRKDPNPKMATGAVLPPDPSAQGRPVRSGPQGCVLLAEGAAGAVELWQRRQAVRGQTWRRAGLPNACVLCGRPFTMHA